MNVYIVCMMHKRTINYYETLKIFIDKNLAEEYLSKVNGGRPLFSQFIIKIMPVENSL